MIRQRDKFSFSEFFYAIDFSTLRIDAGFGDGHATVKAVWFKKSQGEIAVCTGTLSAYGKPGRRLHDETDFIANFDAGRYGGNTMYKWNGTEMWGYQNNFVKLVEAHGMLAPILEEFPNIPTGYTGWYSIKD